MTHKKTNARREPSGEVSAGNANPRIHNTTSGNEMQPSELATFGPIECLPWELPHLERAVHLWCKRSAYEKRDWLTGEPSLKFAHRAIDTTAGSATHWAAVDALHGFKRELEQAGLIGEHDPLARECLQRAYIAASNASYVRDDWPGDSDGNDNV